jgi:DNA-binding NarL/FixJ family response regulator
VDGDRRVRDSLAELLALSGEVAVIGRAAGSAEALDLCSDLAPDALVVDPRLPDVDAGLVLLAELRERFPKMAVLVLSWPGGPVEDAALAAGADGLVPMSDNPSDLVARIVELTDRQAGRRQSPASGRPEGRC